VKYTFLILTSLFFAFCNSQEKKTKTISVDNSIKQKNETQIGQYVTDTYEDSKGHLWFGTIEKGIARYDGNELRYFTQKDGLPSNRVTGIIEDSKGIFWLKTGDGLSKFDGQSFKNFKVNDGVLSNMVGQLFIDSKGIFWVGTWAGVYQFDGTNFIHFPIPNPHIDTKINEDTKNWITEIKEDIQGNIWFARDGYGACKYDGKEFSYFLKKDGLYSNNVTEIELDNQGNIWFGTRVAEKDNPDPENRKGPGGVIKYDGERYNYFPTVKGFNNSDVYEIYNDRSNKLWISTISHGVYKFDGSNFTNYDIPISIMSITEDNNGTLWLSGAGGLYKINQKDEVYNVTTSGPWN